MIKVIKRPEIYAVIVKATASSLKNDKFFKSIVNANRLREVPKNTLKLVRLKTIVGYDKDDFVKDMVSIRTVYKAYKFKR